jgi:hypothetical protein
MKGAWFVLRHFSLKISRTNNSVRFVHTSRMTMISQVEDCWNFRPTCHIKESQDLHCLLVVLFIAVPPNSRSTTLPRFGLPTRENFRTSREASRDSRDSDVLSGYYSDFRDRGYLSDHNSRWEYHILLLSVFIRIGNIFKV